MKAWGFKDRETAEALKRGLGKRELPLPPGTDAPTPNCRTWVAIVTTTITARSSATPGTGAVSLLRLDANGDLSAMKTGVSVKNWSSVSATTGQYCEVSTRMGLTGKWLSALDCG